ncbi:MAG: RNA 3'-terminal phosphate cyclase [Methanobacteriota archaeon]|nr:MAG: RNA 3'-terminal phosphate cyclase [Euryarchaeota archaeon]
MIEIDGSWGEGGGQILRMSVALSAVTGNDVRIVKIRAGRPKPGLAAQHLTSIKSVARLCDAKVDGLDIGSQTVEFHPGRLRGGKFNFDVGTAGSITLVFQACLIPALHAPMKSVLTVTGGTDVRWSPPIDYFQYVFLPTIEKMGVFAKIEKIKRGYYPKGGGKVVLHVEPVEKLAPLKLEEKGNLRKIRGISHVGNIPPHVADRMKKAAEEGLTGAGETSIESKILADEDVFGQGGGIVLWEETEKTLLGANSLAERGIRAEKVGQTASERLMEELDSGATVDVHLSDQILPYMALAKGESCFIVREVSNHIKTNMWLLEHFFDVEFEKTGIDHLHKIRVMPR